ncbi:MAG: hypothetical protein AB7P14_01515 [Blastocatellales bacterium]
MSKRQTDRERLLHKLQQMTDSEVEDLLDYVSLMEKKGQRLNHRDSSKDQKVTHLQLSSDDELLALLSSSYETRRARQVYEWEVVRRKAELRAGNYVR